MNDLSLRCGCGREMTPDALRGRGAYRCGCGARVVATSREIKQCGGYRGDRRCRAVPVAGLPVDLCADHVRELRDHWNLDRSADDVPAEVIAARQQLAALHRPVVYYVRFGDRIKIGWTNNLSSRLEDLPYDEVLATEPGGLEVERARHKQFRALHACGEWFHAREPLLSHAATTGTYVPEPLASVDVQLPDDAMLTAREASTVLGVPIRTFQQWVNRGRLGRAGLAPDGRPVYRYGDAVRAVPERSKTPDSQVTAVAS